MVKTLGMFNDGFESIREGDFMITNLPSSCNLPMLTF